MSLDTVLAELKSTLAEQMEIFVRASTEVKESSAIINKTQAAIAALEGNPLSGYEGFSGRTYPGSIEENAELFNKLGQPMAEPGFFYDSSGQLRPNGWIDVVETEAAIPAFTLPALPTEDFADAGDLLGLRG